MSLVIFEVMYCKPFSLFVIVNTINIVTIFTTMTKNFLQIVYDDLKSYFLIGFLKYKLLIFNQFQFVKELVTTLHLLFSIHKFYNNTSKLCYDNVFNTKLTKIIVPLKTLLIISIITYNLLSHEAIINS